jgi:hypothetical protein
MTAEKLPVTKIVAKSLFIISLTLFILFLLGRTLFYQHGPIAFWSSDINSDQNSQQLFDPYTFTHIIHGIGFYALLWLFRKKIPLELRFLLALILESSWEIIENTSLIIERYRAATISLDYYGDSILNSFGDILAFIFGFYFTYEKPLWLTVSIVALIELLLLILIRDNLSLNILMLLFPIPGIQAWQTGG